VHNFVYQKLIKSVGILFYYYPNVTMWRSGICYRKSVCLYSVRL